MLLVDFASVAAAVAAGLALSQRNRHYVRSLGQSLLLLLLMLPAEQLAVA